MYSVFVNKKKKKRKKNVLIVSSISRLQARLLIQNQNKVYDFKHSTYSYKCI